MTSDTEETERRTIIFSPSLSARMAFLMKPRSAFGFTEVSCPRVSDEISLEVSVLLKQVATGKWIDGVAGATTYAELFRIMTRIGVANVSVFLRKAELIGVTITIKRSASPSSDIMSIDIEYSLNSIVSVFPVALVMSIIAPKSFIGWHKDESLDRDLAMRVSRVCGRACAHYFIISEDQPRGAVLTLDNVAQYGSIDAHTALWHSESSSTGSMSIVERLPAGVACNDDAKCLPKEVILTSLYEDHILDLFLNSHHEMIMDSARTFKDGRPRHIHTDCNGVMKCHLAADFWVEDALELFDAKIPGVPFDLGEEDEVVPSDSD